MPYQISTDYVPYKVLFVRIWGDYSGEDLKNSNTDVNACLDRSGLNTHVITDFRGLVSYPKNIGLLAKAFSMFAHPNMGWEVIITPNATTRFVASTVMQIVKPAHGATRFKAVFTPEEALEFLAHIDPLLPQLSPLPFEPVAW